MDNYSTVDKVRLEAWFSSNDGISDTTIEMYQDRGTGIINSIIGKRYDINALIMSEYFAWSSAQMTLAGVEELLAAGHLLNKDYDIQDLGDDSNGDKKIEAAYKILNDIMTGNILLLDSNGNEFTTLNSSSAGSPIAYPTDTSDRIFTKNQKR